MSVAYKSTQVFLPLADYRDIGIYCPPVPRIDPPNSGAEPLAASLNTPSPRRTPLPPRLPSFGSPPRVPVVDELHGVRAIQTGALLPSAPSPGLNFGLPLRIVDKQGDCWLLMPRRWESGPLSKHSRPIFREGRFPFPMDRSTFHGLPNHNLKRAYPSCEPIYRKRGARSFRWAVTLSSDAGGLSHLLPPAPSGRPL
jgi:hypothetical protein